MSTATSDTDEEGVPWVSKPLSKRLAPAIVLVVFINGTSHPELHRRADESQL